MGETMMREQIPEHGLTIGEQAALLWTAVRSATRIARTFRSMRGTRFCGSGIREKFSVSRGSDDAEGTGKDI